jgi:hypothetical protein
MLGNRRNNPSPRGHLVLKGEDEKELLRKLCDQEKFVRLAAQIVQLLNPKRPQKPASPHPGP